LKDADKNIAIYKANYLKLEKEVEDKQNIVDARWADFDKNNEYKDGYEDEATGDWVEPDNSDYLKKEAELIAWSEPKETEIAQLNETLLEA